MIKPNVLTPNITGLPNRTVPYVQSDHPSRSQPIGQYEATDQCHQRLQAIQFSSNPCISLVIAIRISDVRTYTVIDMAAQVSIISEEVFSQMKYPPTKIEGKVLLTGAAKKQ